MNDAPSFPDFFSAVHGFAPFPWQERLAAQVLESGWPNAIDVPTGLGKTSVLDVFVYCLAAQAGNESRNRTVPTRAVFCVDRRVVVDHAYEDASRTADVLSNPANPATRSVAQRLRSIMHSAADFEQPPLSVVRMRGGVTWAWRWLRQPDQPGIVVGTVDQFGSRYLFRGYGVGPRLRPIDAALVGTDTVVFLDEAHLSRALVDTVRTATFLEARAEEPILPGRSPRIVTMTATPAVLDEDTQPFGVDTRDLAHPVASRRLTARKNATLVDLGKIDSPKKVEQYPAHVAAIASAVAAKPDISVLLVTVNTVGVARQVHDDLASRDGDHDVVLMIGRTREFDREPSRQAWWDRAEVGWRNEGVQQRTLIVVATQTVEVGANLDADALITEAAPVDCLVQRFGRVDRDGLVGDTESVIVHAPARHREDPVYGPVSERAWDWLVQIAGGSQSVTTPKQASVLRLPGPFVVDFGPLELRGSLDAAADPHRLVAQPALGPLPMDVHLDVWSRTSPVPVPDQAVAPFLHGVGSGADDTEIVWRAGLPAAIKDLSVVPPGSGERAQVSIGQARRFISHLPDRPDLSDLESSPDEDGSPDDSEVADVFVYAGPDEARRVRRPGDIRPGAVLVVDSSVGGLDRWGWIGTDGTDPVRDVGDFVTRGRGRRARRVARLTPEVVASVLGVGRNEARGLLGDEWHLLRNRLTDEDDPPAADELRSLVNPVLDRLCEAVTEDDPHAEILRDHWRGLKDGAVALLPSGTGVLVERRGLTTFDVSDDSSASGSSALGGEQVRLKDHLRSVGARAAEYAANIGLNEGLVETLRLAGLAHDVGKADARFQAMLRAGDRLRAEVHAEFDELLAKSGMNPSNRRAWQEAYERSAWPKGMRHEAVSVALIRGLPEGWAPDGVDTELFEHLVAAHHGHSRPLFPPVMDTDPVKVEAVFEDRELRTTSDSVLVDWSQPARFKCLCRRYGWWGLALLETVLRLADMAVSEEGG